MQLLYLSFFVAFVSPLALAQSQTQKVCTGLHKHLSNSSSVYYPGTAGYDAGVTHWANSSSQIATCVVEPGSAEDVAEILKTVGRSRTPFAIKGGGHSTNQGFSSTTGVQIAMSRFRQIEYDSKLQSVVVGAGLVWDEVYEALEPLNVTVVGGRVTGIGVAGFTLGGGYSYLTNMYGLASDNVLEYELVLPTGSIVHVNAASHPDLFFGLRGGFNNLGIVTKFTLKTYPLGPVWGGVVFVSPEYATDVFAATAKFQSTNRDPKAAMLLTLNSAILPDAGPTPVPLLSYNLFYAAPDPAPGVFDDFVSIPTIEVEGSEQSLGTTTLLSIVLGGKPGTYSRSPRALFHTYGFTDYSMEFLNAVWNKTIAEGQSLVKNSLMLISVAIEPFLDSALSHSSTPSLYPAHREQVFLPTDLTMSWSDPAMDEIMHTAARDIIKNLETTASALGQDLSRAVLYSNYALVGQGTTVEQFWGKDHVRRLQALRRGYDPLNVMSLTGGWKV